MITIKISWWLWNQMFQYACWKMLAKKYNTKLIIDRTFIDNSLNWVYTKWPYELDVFDINDDISIFSKIALKFKVINKLISPRLFQILNFIFYKKRYILEKQWEFLNNLPNNSYLNWYWFSYKYFDNFEKDILKIFDIKKNLTLENINILENIKKDYLNTVSIHIRRWDYIKCNSDKLWEWLWSTDYYKKAMEYTNSKLKNPKYIIFSDDIKWVKENLQLSKNVIYIENNVWKWYEDLRLMYSCANHIIANSTFSWWGAYLGKNKNKIIIAPNKWFFSQNNYKQSLYIPKDWITL